MLDSYGPCVKLAYHREKLVAQILYFPESAEPCWAFRREGVLLIDCIYNPTPGAQRLGIGTMLLQSLIRDAKNRRTCLGDRPCRFIVAKAFDTGEALPMHEFYRGKGFLPTLEGDLVYLPVEGRYEPAEPVGDYRPLPEDRGRAIILYRPVCQFSYPFAKRVESLIRGIAPELRTEVIDEWEKPQDSIKRRNCWLIVNARPVRTLVTEAEKFKEEVRRAALD